jgi:hypothetical protein
MGDRPTVSDPLAPDLSHGDADGERVAVQVRQVGGKSGNGAVSRAQLFSANDPGYEKVSKWQPSKVAVSPAASSYSIFSAMTLLLIANAAKA